MSLKIDAPLEKALIKLSQTERVSKSELVRRALHAYATQQTNKVRPQSALEKAGDLVGCFKKSPKDLASNPSYLNDFGPI